MVAVEEMIMEVVVAVEEEAVEMSVWEEKAVAEVVATVEVGSSCLLWQLALEVGEVEM